MKTIKGFKFMLRVCVLGVISLFFVNNLFAQLDPTKPAAVRSAQSIEDEINGIRPKLNSTKESLLEAAQKFFMPSGLQSKYGAILKMLPGMLPSVKLLEAIDEWYGTRYRFGGTTKSGIDCSAFVREVYKNAFDIDLPRTARDQFKAAGQFISMAYLQAGDLLFFNTRGGVSHVGVYLGNNKFAHASSSNGVTVSGLDEKYYAARYLG
ncbi:MAG TPA: C40 family peptidase, partial [Niabella sp.]|nr:C40 family peptidase [Niabella sp.]